MMRPWCRGLFALLFLLAGGLVAQAAGINISRLRCEHLVNPLGIDVVQPRLGWELDSSVPGTAADRPTRCR